MAARRISTAIVAAAPVVMAAVAGSLVTQPAIPTFYAALTKPGFAPPNWLFGPVWTLLYVLMAYAFWRILVAPPPLRDRRGAIVAFLIQIALNAAWPFAFFGWRSPTAGAVVIVALWLAIVATMVAFRRLDSTAAWLLAPYLAWSSCAAALNLAIWRLNG